MRRTPFTRILAIYIAALVVLTICLLAHRMVARSGRRAVSCIAHALQVQRAYAAQRDDVNSGLPLHDHEVIQKTFFLTGAAHHSIEIDNVFGSIEVVGGTGEQIELVVDKNTRAESKDALALAHKEVILDITQPDGGLKLYVDGPFRCNCEDGCQGERSLPVQQSEVRPPRPRERRRESKDRERRARCRPQCHGQLHRPQRKRRHRARRHGRLRPGAHRKRPGQSQLPPESARRLQLPVC